MGGHIVRLDLTIEVGIDFHSRILRYQSRIQLMVFKRCHEVISSQTISGVMQFVHRSFHIETSVRSKDIQAFAIGMEIQRDFANRILREELAYVQVVYHEVGPISLFRQIILGIDTCSTAHLEIFGQGKRIVVHGQLRAVYPCSGSGFRLFQKEIQAHFRTGHGKDTLEARASAECKLPVGQWSEETHVEGFGRKIDFPTPTGSIGKMQQIAIRLKLKGSRQFSLQGAKMQTVQIAIHIHLDTEWFFRISL